MNSIMKKKTMKTNNNIIHMPQEQALMECFLSLLVSVPNFSMFSSANSVVSIVKTCICYDPELCDCMCIIIYIANLNNKGIMEI